ncbi:hypothetical protein DdX_07342 [Ditylenchus destructor]|uniref:Uncharacterized protein n=1 Tax=Ditylenchus destructor TaxID=166010 RepID=A0AAD4R814_9BILA|nr:hypothetical protein DdX_07342 [Ditylenchus destructor]
MNVPMNVLAYTSSKMGPVICCSPKEKRKSSWRINKLLWNGCVVFLNNGRNKCIITAAPACSKTSSKKGRAPLLVKMPPLQYYCAAFPFLGTGG